MITGTSKKQVDLRQVSGVNFVTSVMPPIHLKSGSSTKRGQTCEIVRNGKQFYEERSAGGKRTSARTLQKTAVESAKAGGSKVKVKLSRYTPWRHMGGEEV
jgi:hypothetical protein